MRVILALALICGGISALVFGIWFAIPYQSGMVIAAAVALMAVFSACVSAIVYGRPSVRFAAAGLMPLVLAAGWWANGIFASTLYSALPLFPSNPARTAPAKP